MHPVPVLGAAAGKLPESRPPTPCRDLALLPFPPHLFIQRRAAEGQTEPCLRESHPELEAQDTDLPSPWRLKIINTWSQKRKEKALEYMELAKRFTPNGDLYLNLNTVLYVNT